MTYSTFNAVKNNQLIEPMFFGNNVNVSRYDQQKHRMFEKLREKQCSFFWRPEEIDVSKDRIDFNAFTEAEKHVFVSNIQYQTLLDSVQGRSPNIALLPIASIPELETYIETWSFSETIHSFSYTHILRALYNDPSPVFDEIVEHPEIQKRAGDVTRYYDDLIKHSQYYFLLGEGTHEINGEKVFVNLRKLKEMLYLCINSINALEAIRFYVSFACTFSFAERAKIAGISTIMKLIARDEALHLTGTQYILNAWRNGQDDPEMQEISIDMAEQGREIFIDAAEQEKAWANYLFEKGSVIGLNKQILGDYIEYISSVRMSAIGFKSPYEQKSNPLPWINSYLNSDNVQTAPQENEISSYLVGQVDPEVGDDTFDDFGDI